MSRRRELEPFALPADHVHAGDVRVSLIANDETGRRGVLLEVGTATAILTVDEAEGIRSSLLAAIADALESPAHRPSEIH